MNITLSMYNEFIAAMVFNKLDIECPNCNSILREASREVICTYPGKQRVTCPNCGYIGYKYVL
jgi:transposase-like protein